MDRPSEYNIWDIDLNTDTLNDNYITTDNITNTVLCLIKYLTTTNTTFVLDTDKNEFSLIELFLYNISEFHINRLNNETKEQKKYYPVFWSKTKSYTKPHIHTHIDHCDYEKLIYLSEDNAPTWTTITYFTDDNNTPTLLTDITRHMCNNNKFNHKLNKKLLLVLPRILRHFGFTGGTHLHGEGYLDNTGEIERQTLVLTLWETPPLMSPIFNSDIFYAYAFNNSPLYTQIKPLKETKMYKNTNLIVFKSNEPTIKRIDMINDEIINTDFFNSLIIEKNKNTLFKLKPYIYENLPNISVIEFNIIHHNTWKQISKIHPELKSGLSNWKLSIEVDNYNKIYENKYSDLTCIHNNLLENYIFNDERLFDMLSEYYNQEEHYIYSIAKYHIDRVTKEISETGHNIGEIYASFYINNVINNSLSISSDNTIQTIVTSLETNNDYSIITSINKEMNKYKQIKNSNIGIVYNNNSHVSFAGNYYNKYGKGTLIIRLWQTLPSDMSRYYVNTNNNTWKTTKSIKIEEKNNDVTSVVLEPTIYKQQLLTEIVYNNTIDNSTISTIKTDNNICIFTPTNISIGTSISTVNDTSTSRQTLQSITFHPPN